MHRCFLTPAADLKLTLLDTSPTMSDHHELPAVAPNLSHENVNRQQTTCTVRATLSLAAGRGSSEIRSQVPRVVSSATRAQPAMANAVDTVPLKRLTAGRKALKIAHAGETYLLRITKANKLILTKPAIAEKV